MTERWRLLVRQGAQALLEGRFRECERLADEAARVRPGEPAPGLLAVTACREQGRAAEAEILLRSVLAEHPQVQEGQALLGAVLADLGRDGEAGRQLDLLAPCDSSLAATVLAAETAAALRSRRHAEALHGSLTADAGTFVECHGPVARHLGLLCHVLDRWDEAEAHFRAALRAARAAGAPVLLAHTQRDYSALLRARGAEGDWERAIDLLAEAATIYRRLEIQRLADEAEAVLRRSEDPPAPRDDPSGGNVFRRTPAGWDVAYRGQAAIVCDVPGLGHVAALLAAEGRPVHAVELVGSGFDAELGDQVVGEYRGRLADVESQADGPDPVVAALARAERDFLLDELAMMAGGELPAGEVGDRARRLVALRIRTCLDRIDGVVPALARHLRRSIRSGTFWLYEPDPPERWRMGP